MNIKNEVSVKKVTKDAEEYFRGGYFCCEAVMASIRDNFELDVPKEVIAMSSGMAVGAGCGCIIYMLVFVLSLMDSFSIGITALIKMFIALLSGAAGGVIGVNARRMRK